MWRWENKGFLGRRRDSIRFSRGEVYENQAGNIFSSGVGRKPGCAVYFLGFLVEFEFGSNFIVIFMATGRVNNWFYVSVW